LLPLSPGRLALYNKKARTLFCGHMLAAASVPDLASGADNYLQALEQVEASPIVLLVPLHGPVAKGKKAIRERIAADRNYTQNLVRHALTSIAARLPLERVLSAASAAYEDYPYLDAHLRNLELVWNELSPS
jgi:glyoxylase-like metal-dependent hydrolase (beta-lactamase superfamily II)